MPRINTQRESCRSIDNRRQHTDSHNIIQPSIIRKPSLKFHPQMQIAIGLRRPRGSNVDIRLVLCLEMISSVGVKDVVCTCGSPIGSEVEDFACGELAGTDEMGEKMRTL